MVALDGNLLKDFIGLIPEIPTFADFAIPITPCASEVNGLLNTGNAFVNPLTGAIGECIASLNTLLSDINSLTGFDIAFPKEFNQMQRLLDPLSSTSAVGSFNSLQSHSDGLILDMPQNMALSMACVRARASTIPTSLPSSPCDLLNDVMGTLLGGAAGIIAALVDPFAPIINAIAGGFAALASLIAGAAAAIGAAIAGMIGAIADEIGKLAGILNEVKNFAFANAIPNLGEDPCLQAVFNAVGSGDLLGCLFNNLPNFKLF